MNSPPDPVVIVNCQVFDGREAWPGDRWNVRVEGGKIAAIDQGRAVDAGARRIDAHGAWLIPGLIDAHFHAVLVEAEIARVDAMPPSLLAHRSAGLLRAALRRGFTTVRDAGGADAGLAEAARRGLFSSPRILPSGRALSQTGGHGDTRPPWGADPCGCGQGAGTVTVVADGVDEVRRAVRREFARGSTQIKLFVSGGVSSPTDPLLAPQFSSDEIRAAVDEATDRGSYVMAHAYGGTAIARAVMAGVRTIEHGNYLDTVAAEAMARKGAWLIPTLVTYRALQEATGPGVLAGGGRDKLRGAFEAGLQAISLARAAGVQIGFGTDLLGDMHRQQSREFEFRAETCSAIEMLRSATSVNAAAIGQQGVLGEISVGAAADLLLVRGNPCEDWRVLANPAQSLALILRGGEVIDAAAVS